jgi:hypothetical protein
LQTARIELFTPGQISQERGAFFVSAHAASVPESANNNALVSKVFTKGIPERDFVLLLNTRRSSVLGVIKVWHEVC